MLLYQTRPSNAAATLCDELGIRRITDDMTPIHRRRLRKNGEDPIINWGNSLVHPALAGTPVQWVNNPVAVRKAISKYDSLVALAEADVPAVEVTREAQTAQQWHEQGRCLTRRDGLSGGQGIRHRYWEIAADAEHFYAKLFPKTHEFRVHVAFDTAIDFVEKKAKTGMEINRLIRSHDNGWVFAHENLSVTSEDKLALEELALEAIEVLGLDFGAVDLLATLSKDNPRRLKKARVCEVNTAPGLENTKTIAAYVEAFRSMHNGD